MSTRPRIFVEMEYDRAAKVYLKGLTPENLMEAPTQATQRKITLESLDLVTARRRDFQVFNELLVQYPNPDRPKRPPTQVVPDNMVVLWAQPLRIERSFNLPLQPCGPFWVLEYVSKTNERKDYAASMHKYEHALKVPYYLLFVPDEQELTLYRHSGTKYLSVQPDPHGRYALPEVEMEIALLDGWVRFWYQGSLLLLPAELQRERDAARQQAEEANRQAAQARAEVERLRQQLQALQKPKGE